MLICPFFYLYHLVHRRLPIKSYFIETFYADSPKPLCMNTGVLLWWFGFYSKFENNEECRLSNYLFEVTQLQGGKALNKDKMSDSKSALLISSFGSNLGIQNCAQQLYKIHNLGLLTWPRPVFSFLFSQTSCQT